MTDPSTQVGTIYFTFCYGLDKRGPKLPDVSSIQRLRDLATGLLHKGEENTMRRFLNAALLSAALIVPIALAPTVLLADDHDHVYHDKDHNDDHHWDNHEDRAYRMYVKENHRKYRSFDKIPENDQQAYWGWRHEHSDAVLKINIH
jgi:hypothetical protein